MHLTGDYVARKRYIKPSYNLDEIKMKTGDKKAIVIGATGLVGQALIEQLQQSEEFSAITAVVRKKSDALDTYNKVTQFVLEDFLCLNNSARHTLHKFIQIFWHLEKVPPEMKTS